MLLTANGIFQLLTAFIYQESRCIPHDMGKYRNLWYLLFVYPHRAGSKVCLHDQGGNRTRAGTFGMLVQCSVMSIKTHCYRRY
jgi:hypothetical protein